MLGSLPEIPMHAKAWRSVQNAASIKSCITHLQAASCLWVSAGASAFDRHARSCLYSSASRHCFISHLGCKCPDVLWCR